MQPDNGQERSGTESYQLLRNNGIGDIRGGRFSLAYVGDEMSLEAALQTWYDEERNVEISSFWDGGFTVRLGDSVNGYTATSPLLTVPEIEEWLAEQYQEVTQ
jgi:hypothetical protein